MLVNGPFYFILSSKRWSRFFGTQCVTFSQKKITIKVSYNNDVNALSLVSNFTLNVLTRFFHSTLVFSKPN